MANHAFFLDSRLWILRQAYRVEEQASHDGWYSVLDGP